MEKTLREKQLRRMANDILRLRMLQRNGITMLYKIFTTARTTDEQGSLT